MTNKQFAEQAGLYYEDSITDEEYDLAIERFAQLVRDNEREACAKVCESEGHRIDASWESCATAIRARGNE